MAGTAAGAALLSAVMARRGRPTGLRLAYALGAAGGVAAVLAAAAGSFAGLVAAMVLVGIGNAGNQAARYAAAERHPVARRAAVLSWIVWAATVGAVAGPSLPLPLRSLATGLGLPPEAAGFLVTLACFAAALAVVGALQPAPGPAPAVARRPDDGEPTARFGAVVRLAQVRPAVVTLVAAQATMVVVMSVTALHIRDGGHDLGVVGLVMSAHFVGMFACAPAAGVLVGRLGARTVAVLGLVLLAVGAAGAGLSGQDGTGLSLWLYLLGLGWSGAFVASSAVLSGSLPAPVRLRVQGGVDALVWSVSAVAGAASGLLLDRVGFAGLGAGGAVLALLPLGVLMAAPPAHRLGRSVGNAAFGESRRPRG